MPSKKATKKAVKAIDELSSWVPAPSSVGPNGEQYLMKDGPSTIMHGRAGQSDAARHKEPLAKGRNRITYRIASRSTGFGMLLGVCDGAAWEQAPAYASDITRSIFGKPDKKPLPREWAAWGLCPSSGKLVRAHDVCKGHLAGGLVDKQLAPKPKTGSVRGMTVVVECSISPLDPSSQEAATLRRGFSRTLHPLDMRGARHGTPARRPNTLSISVNGSKLVEADVALPDVVYPWVLLTWEGDAVTLVGVERLGDSACS